MEESENALGLEPEDLENMKTIMDDLIEAIVGFNSMDDKTEAHFAKMKDALDFASFVVNGVMYAHGMDLCAGHDHDEMPDQE